MERNEGKKKFSEFFILKDSFSHNFYRVKIDTTQNLKGVELPDEIVLGVASDHMTVFDTNYVRIDSQLSLKVNLKIE